MTMNQIPHFQRAVLLGMITVASACSAGPKVEIKNQKYAVELADSDYKREIGLMYRHKMPLDRGMLFVFDAESPQAFWMKNTLIPLDIMYFDADYRFVSASYRTPPCRESNPQTCPTYPSDGPVKYVLELNAGVGEDLSLKAGDPMVFHP